VARFLLSQANAGYIVFEHFNQDSIESLFDQQRSRGYSNNNPSIQQFMQNKFRKHWLLAQVAPLQKSELT